MISLAPWAPAEWQACPHGEDHGRTLHSGEARDATGVLGVYHAWVYDHDPVEVYVDMTFGGVGQETATDRVTFGTRYGPVHGQDEPACSLVTGAEQAPESARAWYGQRLTREQALGHPLLGTFWEVVDEVLDHIAKESEPAHEGRCSCCDGELDEHDRHFRFGLPDRVAVLPGGHETAGIGMSDPDPYAADFLESADLGCFVRAMLRTPLTDGYALTCCVWVAVTPEDARRIGSAWGDPSLYAALRFEGKLANALPHFGLLDAPVSVAAGLLGTLPSVVSSDDPDLSRILVIETDADSVLADFPG